MGNHLQKRKGLPKTTIRHIWRGHPNTKLMEKERNEYGPVVQNAVGSLQWSEISTLLFIIYLDDLMNDYKSLNDNKEIPRRHSHAGSENGQCALVLQIVIETCTLQTGHRPRQMITHIMGEIKMPSKN